MNTEGEEEAGGSWVQSMQRLRSYTEELDFNLSMKKKSFKHP